MKDNVNNMRFFDNLKVVPDEAKKKISGGKLAGMTDINPMWRIKVMTENFGMCGFGWKYEITKQWNETYGQVVKTYCNINLYVKVDGEWSDAIPGTGGSSFVSVTKNGAEVSDENMKMALTDALSVAMKALGVGGDVYWDKGKNFESKYSVAAELQPAGEAAAGGNPCGNAQGTVAAAAVSEEEMDARMEIEQMVKPMVAQANSIEELKKLYDSYPQFRNRSDFVGIFSARKKQIEISTK